MNEMRTRPFNEEVMMQICSDVFALNGRTMDIEKIRSKSRIPEVVMQRKLVTVALRNSHYSFESIGKFLHRPHLTPLYLFNKCVWTEDYKYSIIEPKIETEIKEKIRYHQMEINKLMGGVGV